MAKAMTNYLDSLLGDPQKRFMKHHFPMHLSFLGEYPDVASFLFIMFIARKYTNLIGEKKTSRTICYFMRNDIIISMLTTRLIAIFSGRGLGRS